ncbi:hypothetical protein BGZ97_011407 [Linnemannia gamsii]|uniref:Uncharacterized protein n=1 Tax=Linnemannia gamsii TaxID=64522 RepID=A0A9P6RK01_9FUNG|nr:hypothetical protein BGZ97_011407 [Linnemannia gamsii]
MPTACQRFFDIPELTASLNLFLCTKDRNQLLSTSRSLYKVFAPLSWSHFNIKLVLTVGRLFKSPEAIQSLAQHVECVQSLETSSFFFKTYMENILAFAQIQQLERSSLSDTGTGTGGAVVTAPPPPKWLPPLRNRSMIFDVFTLPPIAPMRNLLRLHCCLTRLEMDGDKLGLRQSYLICWLLRLNLRLTKLHLEGLTLSNALLVRVLNRTLPRLFQLRDLHLESSCEVSMDAIKSLFLSCPISLEALSLKFQLDDNVAQPVPVSDTTVVLEEEAADEDGDDDEGFPVVRRNGPLPNLTKLIMPKHLHGYPTSIIEFFLRDCPSLQMWEVPNLESMPVSSSHDVGVLLGTFNPKIRQLTTRDESNHCQEFLNVIKSMPPNQLETLTALRYSDNTPGELWEVLEPHKEVFRELVILETYKASTLTFQQILRNCPQLTKFSAMTIHDQYAKLRLEDVASVVPWVCLNLTHVCLTLDLSGTGAGRKYDDAVKVVKSGRIPLPFVWTAQEQACWRQLETMYTQLGSLAGWVEKIEEFWGLGVGVHARGADHVEAGGGGVDGEGVACFGDDRLFG